MSILEESDLCVYTLKVAERPRWQTQPAFSGSASKSCGKIYMLVGNTGDATVHYVGHTTASMNNRFNNGFSATNKYKYKWAVHTGAYRLFVWDISKHCPSRSLLEGVEAELVLGVRLAQKAWPQHQTGIYFRHLVDQRGLQLAPRLAQEMMKQYYETILKTNISVSNAYIENERDRLLELMNSILLPGS